ncbi:MAG: hypothetical protein K8R02_04790 [Anaerohalosphaeraceae bacterium]|nr:hypothetical protein [Anaerohalosphaeraceae bacterium]
MVTTNLQKRSGFVMIIALMCMAVLTVLAVSMVNMSSANVQISKKLQDIGSCMFAADSGLECGKYIIDDTLAYLPSSGYNYVTDSEADTVWATLCQRVQAQPWVNNAATQVGANEIITPVNAYSQNGGTFRVRFCRTDSHTILLESIGADENVTRRVSVQMDIKKDSEVMNYAIASRGRMWITGKSTIYGDVYSPWDRADIAPFNMTSDSTLEGTINTVLTLDEIQEEGAFQLETLDASGNPVFDEYGERVYSEEDEIQGSHQGINYGQEYDDMPGMDISDYDTDMYYDIVMGAEGNGSIPESSVIQTEYFPHASGDYTAPKSWSSRALHRHVYEDETFTDQRLPDNRNALFKNCTFEGVLYVDCYKSASSKYNNVRFENCTFEGTIVTDVPQSLKWQKNCLYFTGEATFNNTSDIQEATILAPHFNVDLGNANPEQNDNNVLTGAIVGGIVDVRGNAQINGTIISMCDTTGWSSGFVTNIGATLNDGGSETTELGDIGVITIMPDSQSLLPSGIITPIVIDVAQQTYSETF